MALRKQYSPDEKKRIMDLYDEGYTYKDIAEKIRPGIKTAWRTVGDIIRAERKKEDETKSVEMLEETKTHSTSITKKVKSSVQLPDSMSGSATARELMMMLDDEQREVFVSTYENLRGQADEDELTSAENESLIRASYANVKYLRAHYMLMLCESYLMMELDGELSDTEEDKAKKRLAGRGDSYKKEAEQWSKEYNELLNDLKLTRKQRLDKIKDTRNTLLDLQEELMKKARQSSIVEEIKKINMATKEEFYRMAEGEVGPDGARHPWLIGAFGNILEKDKKDESD